MQSTLFELKNISKYFAKVVANKNVSIDIRRGEVIALLGENGAGKSTIMKILYGLYKLDEGMIFKDGKRISIDSPKTAMRLGISMIQQHFSLVGAHTVLENIILSKTKGIINYKKCKEELLALSKHYKMDVPLDEKCKDLDVGTRQKVEILKALYIKSDLLIMDEPTAVLTPQEADNLMLFVREYVKEGNSVVLITHKMKEVSSVADKIIVMRNGSISGELENKNIDEVEIARLMVGKDLDEIKNDINGSSSDKDVCLEFKNVTALDKDKKTIINNISFKLHKGEILGVAGVSGNGTEELCELVSGLIFPNIGSIELNNEDISFKSIKERIRLGIGYVPVDRHKDAMISNMSISENILLKSLYKKEFIENGFIDRKKLNNLSKSLIKEFDVKTISESANIGSLSGGNQQKVILAREVYNSNGVLVLNQPTRGLDIGAINNIHSVIIQEKKKGTGVLLVSTELSEIFAICDRIAVIYKGEFMGIYNRAQLDREKIGLLMAGIIPKEET